MFTRSLHTGSITRRVLFAGLFVSFSLSLLAADGSRAAGDSQSQDQAIGVVLSAASSSPAQVSFSPDGDALLVTERATNLISRLHAGA